RDSDLQVAKEQEAEPPGLLPECVVLLVRNQLAEAEDRDLLSLRRAQLRPPGARIRRPQRSIRPGPAVPVLLAVERFERPVELLALQPFPARPPRDSGAPRPTSSPGSPGSERSCTESSRRRIPSARSASRTSSRSRLLLARHQPDGAERRQRELRRLLLPVPRRGLDRDALG